MPPRHRDTPHPVMAFSEPLRALSEMSLLAGTRRALGRVPRGDGHSVIVIPGFLGSDGYNRFLRNYLKDLGYHAKGWGLGRNMGPSPEREQAMLELVEREYARSGRKVSLIGHSLGGVYAREMGKLCSDKVRQVISLGSPFSHPEDAQEPPIARLFRYFNPDMGVFEENRAAMAAAPPVPYTSIFTAGDGIVHWTQCVQHDGHAQVENIRVNGSHAGLAMNPAVFYVVADRLAQPEGEWRRFKYKRLNRLLIPRTPGNLRRGRFSHSSEVGLV